MKTKRLLAGAMAFILTISGSATAIASAADTVKLEAEKVSAAAGEEFTLNVSISGVPSNGISAAEFAVKYDSSIVEVTGVKAGKSADTGADSQNTDISSQAPTFSTNFETAGEIDVTWSSPVLGSNDYLIKTDGVFLTITGTVKSTAKAGDVSEFAIGAIDREEAGDSSTLNSDIVFAFIDSDVSVTNYDVATTNGSVTVLGAEETKATEAVTDAETEKATTTTVKPTEQPTEATSGEVDVTIDPTALYGDVNCDGSVEVADVVLLNKSIVGAATLSASGKINADAYLDGSVDANDAMTILKRLVLSIDSLPVTAS
jgi:hypothetical protein